MKKLLVVLVLALGFTSCSQDCDLDLGTELEVQSIEGFYQRVSYTVALNDGTFNTYPQAVDGSELIVSLQITEDSYIWIYGDDGVIVGERVGNQLFIDGVLQYTLNVVSGDVINALVYGAGTDTVNFAFETFKIK
tara:strand:+ start:455 stop:859 length:405 start_codon:yes stop_codon:yes gene_type:complete